jgi:hypothetical protein
LSKRVSGAPRHPRSPVAKAVRTPAFKMQVVPDKRWSSKLKEAENNNAAKQAPEENAKPSEKVEDADQDKD